MGESYCQKCGRGLVAERCLMCELDKQSGAASLKDKEDRLATLEGLCADLMRSLDKVLRTGLNGGNNVRLSLLAASQKALGPEDLALADESESASNEARALIQKAAAYLKEREEA